MRVAVAGATGLIGRHIVEIARGRGHEAVPLSRGQGVDVVTGVGLSSALSGCEAIIDATNSPSRDEADATHFFQTGSANLQRDGAERGVRHLITLSIVGLDAMPFGYYNAKLAQERAAGDGSVPNTILRATQFHEFPAQRIAATRDGDRATVFDLQVQTVAGRTVAEALVDLAEGVPKGRAPDLGGPQVASLVELARRLVAARGAEIEIVADAESMAALPEGANLPGDGAQLAGPTFDEWLAGDDAAALSL